MFETKIAIIVRQDLAAWQKLNVTAFLASGIAAAHPDCIGEAYVDAAGQRYTAMIGQPILIFAASLEQLQKVHRAASERGLTIAPYVEPMFSTGHDAANREVFRASDPHNQPWVGLALHGQRKAVDKAVKGLPLHG
ncbi:DUF2000 family protein [uncultured Ferrovibrio sp.]|jgi:hypothetical protein|uniref:DUF2000 family protein n=1 Tax=uncultured Ferrovibrio sp. TaxID=1576913 RepID=UPI002611A451|nr:DUF2000 family protein [uncultured Ferrovibrio sp.]